ncbi:MAG: ABC transporter ATP-binding protein/permease [Treponemataceae bacterium]|nr:ABC transporter ATP-binding protein/permease [Treponemataceae bacterium]
MADFFDTDVIVKEYDSRIAARILSYLKPYWFLAAVALLALVLSTVGELAVPVILRRLMDGVLLNGNISVAQRVTALWMGVIRILGLLAVVFLANFGQTYWTALIAQRVMRDIRLGLFEKTIHQSSAFLSRHPVGRLVTRLTGDVETINEFFTSVLGAFLKDFSIMIGVIITMFLLSVPLALVTCGILPLVTLVSAYNRIKARDAFRRQRHASSALNAYLSEHLSGIHIVQLFAQERRSSREFSQKNQDLLAAGMNEMYVYATFRPLIDFLAQTALAVILFFGSQWINGEILSVGTLVAFISLINMFFMPVQDLAEKYTLLQQAMAGGERVFTLMDVNEHIPDTGHIRLCTEQTPLTRLQCKGKIEFRHVQFSYVPHEPVLQDVSFVVEPGTMVAVVGYTGAGKTTLTNVLTRLWDVQGGEILLDDIPITEIALSDVRRAIVPVLQDVFLFSGTIHDNIALGLPLTREDVIRCAKAVHAHEFIERLPQGYDTILSEGATNVSAGQRQLISFARLVAHDPRVIVLDEATSNIDTETEHLIQLGLAEVLKNRTSIVIAHRLSTIRHADRIIVLSEGRVIEEGHHDVLIAQGGLYATLYRLQYEENLL